MSNIEKLARFIGQTKHPEQVTKAYITLMAADKGSTAGTKIGKEVPECQ